MPLTRDIPTSSDSWLSRKDDHGQPWKWNGRHVALAGAADYHQWFPASTEKPDPVPHIDCAAHTWEGWEGGTTLAAPPGDPRVLEILDESKYLAVEFDSLSKLWQRETRHMSLVSEKITHPAYLRIIGMGEAALPLLLAALRERPAHWFTALRAISNADPASLDDSPAMAREAWIRWGVREGYID